ncbi:hypothetical protein NHP164001_10600 [Helicobacter trogontum]|uniref:Flavodoxin-like fold domain-containing protein n=1 Tax=Helicobacter trogontum TaxID=50960 RepID=A0ABQ0D3X9_9HELI
MGEATQTLQKIMAKVAYRKIKYMFSLTWNAPIEAFNKKDEFFEGVGVDGVYLHLHKANQFLGMQPLPTFICNDVIKNPQVEKYITDYKQHLLQIFKN